MKLGPSSSTGINVLRLLVAIVLMLCSAVAVLGALSVDRLQARIIDPATTTQVAALAWRDPSINAALATATTAAIVRDADTARRLAITFSPTRRVPADQQQAFAEAKLLPVVQRVFAAPQSEQLFVQTIAEAHTNFAAQLTSTPPDQINPASLFVIDLRPVLPSIAAQLGLGTAWINQVPPSATIVRLNAPESNLSWVRALARFEQTPTWYFWAAAALFGVLALLLTPWRAPVLGTFTLAILMCASFAAGLEGVLDQLSVAVTDPAFVEFARIVIGTLVNDAAAVRDALLVTAGIAGAATVVALVIGRAQRRRAAVVPAPPTTY